ncbi:MAG TPA: di-heme oxidoredictase family protein [Blastocatellia bacterium]|nr:di-heme oxidoredictase family protein [Blastocatellia bacterium]
MKILKLVVLLLFVGLLISPVMKLSVVRGQTSVFPGQVKGSIDSDPAPGDVARCIFTEAATGFDDRSISELFVPDEKHNADQQVFDDFELIPNGLGPVYNAQSCRECHQNTTSGGISQITELRAGIVSHGLFFNPTVRIVDDNGVARFIENRSLINDRAICPAGPLIFTLVPDEHGHPFNHPDANIQERVDNIVDAAHNPVPEELIVTTFRTSLNLLGDGLVECVNSNSLQAIRDGQPAGQKGTLVLVKLLEVPNDPTFRVGRFGWKNQQASLLSFSSDAYLNEMGITNRFPPNNEEVTKVCDEIPDFEDNENPPGSQDIDTFARFIRATKAPPRAPRCETCPNPDPQIVHGSQLFEQGQMGCAICHVRTLQTDPVGTWINGNTFQIPQGLGCRIFHPFGDFLLHDIGTGDHIVQTVDANGDLDQSTANLMRTAPLWGVRTRDRLIHDGESLTFVDAIRRHHNQAQLSFDAFFGLDSHHFTDSDRSDLIAFLKSL